jgi:uncharacterized protein (DUF1800 family)
LASKPGFDARYRQKLQACKNLSGTGIAVALYRKSGLSSTKILSTMKGKALSRQELQHLMLRAGFGLRPSDLARFEGKTREEAVSMLFQDSTINQPILYIPRPDTKDNGEVSTLKALLMVLKSKEDTEKLNLAWLDRMAVARAVLREKMILFWHNHFATGTAFAWLMQVQHNTLREHALGNFRTMLHAVAKDPSMILYLNNQQNKKKAPNENFAREVMELFTLGEGQGYTEFDIKQAARAFTGWTVNMKGEYEFKAEDHDEGEKTIFGKTGRFSGEDVLEMLLERKQTATYVCRKLYRLFVNATINEDHVAELAKVFYNSGYDISATVKYMLLADWFYAQRNIGCIISSPTELIVRYKRLLKLETEDKQVLALQDVLGQTLFFPPNVAGWKGGRNWIDSLSLLYRVHLPTAIVQQGTVKIKRKPAFEEKNDGKSREEKRINIKTDWSELVQFFKPSKDLTTDVIAYFIQSPQMRIDRKAIDAEVDSSTPERKIITTIAAVMKLPEFQLI